MFDLENYLRNFFEETSPAALPLWEEVYSEMIVHTHKANPRYLISARRPNESHNIKDYRVATYEPITRDPIVRAIDHLQRIMNEAGISINTSDALKEHRMSPVFEGMDFMSYMTHRVIPRMIDDPNGVLVWFPKGEGLTSETEQVEVKPFLLLSKNIHHFTKHVISWLSERRTPVTVGGNTVNEGKVYVIVTDNEYLLLEQFGDRDKEQYRRVPIYTHGLGYLPVVILGGIPSIGNPAEIPDFDQNGEILTGHQKRNNLATTSGGHNHDPDLQDDIEYLTSFFGSYVPWANEAIRQFSDHQGIMVTSAFPIKEMKEEPCPNRGQHEGSCHDGYVTIIGESGSSRAQCDSCHGRGFVMPNSPYGVILRGSKDFNFDSEKPDNTPALRYITPDVNILKYSGEVWEKYLHKGEKALNQVFTDEAQSGKAKEIDREDRVSSLDKIGHNIIRIIKNSLIINRDLRFINDNEDVVVMPPATFHQRTMNDVLEELTQLKESNAPAILRAEVASDLFKKRFPGNPRLHKVVDLVKASDPLFGLDTEEVNMLFASGRITEPEQRLNLKAYSTAMELSSEDRFMDRPMAELVTLLVNKINGVG